MLRSAGTNLMIAFMAWSLASQGALAAPLPKFSIPKLGGSSKPSGPPPRTNNDAGEPISFMDSDSVLDQPVGSASSGTGAKIAKGAAIAGFVTGVAGAGASAGYAANENAADFGSL